MGLCRNKPVPAHRFVNQFERIAAILAQERVEPRCLTLKNLGGRFAPQGTVDQLYRAFGLDARSVADSVEEMLHEQ